MVLVESQKSDSQPRFSLMDEQSFTRRTRGARPALAQGSLASERSTCCSPPIWHTPNMTSS